MNLSNNVDIKRRDTNKLTILGNTYLENTKVSNTIMAKANVTSLIK